MKGGCPVSRRRHEWGRVEWRRMGRQILFHSGWCVETPLSTSVASCSIRSLDFLRRMGGVTHGNPEPIGLPVSARTRVCTFPPAVTEEALVSRGVIGRRVKFAVMDVAHCQTFLKTHTPASGHTHNRQEERKAKKRRKKGGRVSSKERWAIAGCRRIPLLRQGGLSGFALGKRGGRKQARVAMALDGVH